MTEATSWLSGMAPDLDELRMVRGAPPEPGPGEVIVKVHAAAINYSDLLMLADRYQVKPERPFVPGQEIAGTVVACGPNTQLRPGQRLASKVLWGGFSTHARVREDMAIPLPDDLGFAEAAALPIAYTTALVALTESVTLEPGQRVLVHAAAGGVGLAAVQIAKACGAVVLAAAGSPEKCELTKKHGADFTFDYRRDELYKTVMAATEEDGVDVVFDSVGGNMTKSSMRCLAWGGKLLIVGFSSGQIPEIRANRLLLRRASAIGVYWNHDLDGPMIARVTDRMLGLWRAKKLQPVVNTDFALEELPQALGLISNRRAVGKVVLRVGEDEGAA